MPYKLLKAPDDKGYYVQNIHTGHRYSSEPMSLEKAEAQMRILNNVMNDEKAHYHRHHHSSYYDPHKFAQEVVAHMKKGTLTAQATKHHEKPLEFAEEVLAHPEKHSLKLRRKAQFLHNIQKK